MGTPGFSSKEGLCTLLSRLSPHCTAKMQWQHCCYQMGILLLVSNVDLQDHDQYGHVLQADTCHILLQIMLKFQLVNPLSKVRLTKLSPGQPSGSQTALKLSFEEMPSLPQPWTGPSCAHEQGVLLQESLATWCGLTRGSRRSKTACDLTLF